MIYITSNLKCFGENEKDSLEILDAKLSNDVDVDIKVSISNWKDYFEVCNCILISM